jgi:hypothetical protein
MNNQTLKRGIYQHFKDKTMIYEVLGVGMHTETKEMSAVYRGLYGDFQLYIRPIDMFLEEVDKPELSYKGPRFTLIKVLE